MSGRKIVNTDRGAKIKGGIYLYADTWEYLRGLSPEGSASVSLQQLIDNAVSGAATGTPLQPVVKKRVKRVPMCEEDYMAAACEKRGITTPSLVTRQKIMQEYLAYLKGFK
jgi:hypothetical protein